MGWFKLERAVDNNNDRTLTMTASPRRQMEEVAFKRKGITRECAQYVLDHEDYLPLLKGRQAYFRDFILTVVENRLKLPVDDAKIPELIQTMIDSGYMWDVFNRVKSSRRIARSVVSAVLSIQASGHEVEYDGFISVFRVMVEPRSVHLATFTFDEDQAVMHHLVVERLLSDPEAVQALINILDSRITDPLLALSLLDEGLVAPLLSGAL